MGGELLGAAREKEVAFAAILVLRTEAGTFMANQGVWGPCFQRRKN